MLVDREIVFCSIGAICLTNSGYIPANCFLKIANIPVNWITNNENISSIHFSHLGISHAENCGLQVQLEHTIWMIYILDVFATTSIHIAISLDLPFDVCCRICLAIIGSSSLPLHEMVSGFHLKHWNFVSHRDDDDDRWMGTRHIWLNAAMSGSTIAAPKHTYCNVVYTGVRASSARLFGNLFLSRQRLGITRVIPLKLKYTIAPSALGGSGRRTWSIAAAAIHKIDRCALPLHRHFPLACDIFRRRRRAKANYSAMHQSCDLSIDQCLHNVRSRV